MSVLHIKFKTGEEETHHTNMRIVTLKFNKSVRKTDLEILQKGDKERYTTQ